MREKYRHITCPSFPLMVRMRPRRAHRWLNNVHRESRYFVDTPVAKRHMFLPPSSTSLCPRPVLLYLWIVSSALSLYIMIPPSPWLLTLLLGTVFSVLAM